MTDPDSKARNRYFIIALARLAGAGVAIFGMVLLARSFALPQQLAAMAIVLGGIGVMAFLPRALVQRWRTPPE